MKIGIAYPAFQTIFEKSFRQEIIDLTINKSEIENCDLVIFSGGEDISPSIYGQVKTYTESPNELRDKIEYDIFNYCRNNNIKVLGVCRGHQLINAILGGAIIQDLYAEGKVFHLGEHDLSKISESKILGNFSIVNSLHHQGVIHPGRELNPIFYHKKTRWGDYIIEACENENIITVQFHPEFMSNAESREFFEKIKQWATTANKKINKRKSTKDTYLYTRKYIDSNPAIEPGNNTINLNDMPLILNDQAMWHPEDLEE